MKTAVVAGGAGFLGSHLCGKLLESGYKVICIDNLITGNMNNILRFNGNPNFHFSNFDIVNEGIDVSKINEIYNLACIASPDKYKEYAIETLKTCFMGNMNLLELAVKHNAKYLFASTSEVYGDPTVHPQPETYYGNVNTVGERSCYDEGKRVSETLVYEYRRKYGMDAKIVRIFNTYGPNMDINDGRVITNFIKSMMNNEPFRIYGSGNQTRSFCYVDDLIAGILGMMNSIEQGPINIGNPDCELTLNELVEVFKKCFPEKNIIVDYIAATQDDPQQRKPDITKARSLIGFAPSCSLEEGLKKTVDHFYMGALYNSFVK